jgi:hypothetical protein
LIDFLKKMGYFASASTSAFYAANEKLRAESVPDNTL